MRLSNWLHRLWLSIRSWWTHPPGEEEEDFGKAEKWTESTISTELDLEDGVYTPILRFAERKYDQLTQRAETLDKKADALIQLASAISVAVLGGAKAGLTQPEQIPLVTAAVVLFILSVVVASRCRAPIPQPVPTKISNLFKRVKEEEIKTPGKVEGLIAAQFHTTCVGMTNVLRWKGTHVRRATTLICLGLFVLAMIALFYREPPVLKGAACSTGSRSCQLPSPPAPSPRAP